ncbi:hypothetical protein BIFDEN_01162 [Bifidobacterium dentium ATCC 27678]|nr:hypothetical protein BIFDEN_01162 [Bifidobacterium dentium ATCC 27678]
MHGVALAQTVLLDLTHGNVYVIRSRQVAGGAHECVGFEHVDDAGDRYEVFLRLLATLLTLGMVVVAIVTLVAIDITATIAAATILTVVEVAVASTHAASAAVGAIVVAIALIAATAMTGVLAILGIGVVIVFGIVLRGQSGENVIEIAHDILILRLFHGSTAATAGLVVEIVLATATTILLLRLGTIDIEFGKQVGSAFGITTLATLATLFRGSAQCVKRLHCGLGLGGIRRRFIGCGFSRSLYGLLTAASGLVRRHLCVRLFGGFRGFGGLDVQLIDGGIGVDCGLCRSSALRRTYGNAGRRFAAGTGGPKRCEELGLTHGGGTAKSHLLGELFELRQFHIFKIWACCHWFMPFLGFTGTRLQQLKKELRKIRRMKGSPRIITVFELRQPYNAIQTNAKTMRTSRGRRQRKSPSSRSSAGWRGLFVFYFSSW